MFSISIENNHQLYQYRATFVIFCPLNYEVARFIVVTFREFQTIKFHLSTIHASFFNYLYNTKKN